MVKLSDYDIENPLGYVGHLEIQDGCHILVIVELHGFLIWSIFLLLCRLETRFWRLGIGFYGQTFLL